MTAGRVRSAERADWTRSRKHARPEPNANRRQPLRRHPRRVLRVEDISNRPLRNVVAGPCRRVTCAIRQCGAAGGTSNPSKTDDRSSRLFGFRFFRSSWSSGVGGGGSATGSAGTCGNGGVFATAAPGPTELRQRRLGTSAGSAGAGGVEGVGRRGRGRGRTLMSFFDSPCWGRGIVAAPEPSSRQVALRARWRRRDGLGEVARGRDL